MVSRRRMRDSGQKKKKEIKWSADEEEDVVVTRKRIRDSGHQKRKKM